MFLPSNITLKFGDSGDFVAEMQRRLARVGAFSEAQVNGFFDGATVNAVTSFQSREGLHADGVAGPETLRRLNGVVAGDTSSASSGSKEDETAKAAQQQAVDYALLNQSPVIENDPFAYAAPTHAPFGEDAYRPPEALAAPETLLQPNQAQLDQQRAREQMQRDSVQQQAPAATDLLAQMLLQTPPPAPADQISAPNRHERPPIQSEMPKVDFASAAPAKEPAEKIEKPAAPEPRSLVGKAVQFANSMLQKMADYFEAKLPPSVLKEVQAIGLTMAQGGLKEAPIPTGPDLPTRAPELPTRGPEQVQQRS